MQSVKIILAMTIFLLTGITSVPLAMAGATADTIVVHFDETRIGLTCIDPAGTGTGTFSVVMIIHIAEDPQGRFLRVFTAAAEFTYVTSDGVTFTGHETFHSTVALEPGGILHPLRRVVSYSGQAQGSDGSIIGWTSLSVSVNDILLQDRFECDSS